MGLTAQSIIDSVRAQLPSTSVNFWTDADIVRVYNDALDEISDATETYERSVVIRRRKNAIYTDLRGIMAPSALRIRSIWNPDIQRWLFPTTVKELDESVGRGWEKSPGPGTAAWWFMRGLWYLGIYPAADSDSTSVKVYFTACMPHVSIDGGLSHGLGAEPPIPHDFGRMVENYMLYALWSEQREAQKALAYWGMYKKQEQDFREFGQQRMNRPRTFRIGAHR